MMTEEPEIHPADEESTVVSGEAPPESNERTGEIDLGRVRELVLSAHPDVVPEMVRGATFDELLESVEPAREAYQRIASETAQSRPAPRVAAQPSQRNASLVDMESLSPLGKISEGLRRSGA
jgi:hypothetical protein